MMHEAVGSAERSIAKTGGGKVKVLFVGGFSQPADGTKGGQLAACIALRHSPIQEIVEWQLIDSTQVSHPPPALRKRAWNATKRVLAFTKAVFTGGNSSALIFTSYDILSFAEKGLMCLIASIAGKRVVLSIRSEVRTQASFRFLFPFRYVVLRCCDAVICQSDAAAATLRALFSQRIVTTVIPNWIDAKSYRASENTGGHTRRIGTESIGFVFCGWLEKQKGVFELVDAAAKLKRLGLSFIVTVCGGGRERQSLEQRILQYGLTNHFRLAGWVDSLTLKEILRGSDIFVLPSHTEGLPNAILEAMATGLPVISTPVGGIPSIIRHGENGFLVTTRDAEALANAMHTLAIDPGMRSQMGQRNLRQIAEKHDINRVWKQVARALSVI
jgi:glycosyltransferase involved in cell wall biosynthesis